MKKKNQNKWGNMNPEIKNKAPNFIHWLEYNSDADYSGTGVQYVLFAVWQWKH